MRQITTTADSTTPGTIVYEDTVVRKQEFGPQYVCRRGILESNSDLLGLNSEAGSFWASYAVTSRATARDRLFVKGMVVDSNVIAGDVVEVGGAIRRNSNRETKLEIQPDIYDRLQQQLAEPQDPEEYLLEELGKMNLHEISKRRGIYSLSGFLDEENVETTKMLITSIGKEDEERAREMLSALRNYQASGLNVPSYEDVLEPGIYIHGATKEEHKTGLGVVSAGTCFKIGDEKVRIGENIRIRKGRILQVTMGKDGKPNPVWANEGDLPLELKVQNWLN